MNLQTLHTSPAIATFTVDTEVDLSTWKTERFDMLKMVEALASVQSKNIVSLEGLQTVEEKVHKVAPVLVVNPRGQAHGGHHLVDLDDDIPSMDRFEVVLDDQWAPELSNASQDFALLSAHMVEAVRNLAGREKAASLSPYWRLIVSFTGASAQKWYADDVNSNDIFTCEVPITDKESVHTVFPLNGDAPVDLEGMSDSELRLRGCVIYSGGAVHYYEKVDSPTPRISLQLIMSPYGDPNDGIPSEDEDDEDD